MTENDVPVSELGENPEEKAKEAWEQFLDLVGIFTEDKAYVESIEIVREEK